MFERHAHDLDRKRAGAAGNKCAGLHRVPGYRGNLPSPDCLECAACAVSGCSMYERGAWLILTRATSSLTTMPKRCSRAAWHGPDSVVRLATAQSIAERSK